MPSEATGAVASRMQLLIRAGPPSRLFLVVPCSPASPAWLPATILCEAPSWSAVLPEAALREWASDSQACGHIRFSTPEPHGRDLATDKNTLAVACSEVLPHSLSLERACVQHGERRVFTRHPSVALPCGQTRGLLGLEEKK